MPKYRVERKCYYQNRLFDPDVQSVVNLDVEPKNMPRHFTRLDKPKKQPKQPKQDDVKEPGMSGEDGEAKKTE